MLTDLRAIYSRNILEQIVKSKGGILIGQYTTAGHKVSL